MSLFPINFSFVFPTTRYWNNFYTFYRCFAFWYSLRWTFPAVLFLCFALESAGKLCLFFLTYFRLAFLTDLCFY